MSDDQTIYCPFCGKNIPSDVDKCPFCSTPIDRVHRKRELDRIIEHRVMRKIKSSSKPKRKRTPSVPKAPLPDMKVSCPGCGLELAGGETKCTRCGIPLAGKDDLLECPDCGSSFAPGAKNCPKCGVSFEEEPDELLPAPEPEPPPRPAPAPEPVPVPEPRQVSPPAEVVTMVPAERASNAHGLTNGRGAVNGTGLVNGTGMVNGTGLVNGTGMINGTKADGRASSGSRGRRGGAVARWQFLAVLVALVIIIPTFIYLSYSKESSTYSIDGDFGEWEGVDSYGVSILSTTPVTVVDSWSVAVEDTKIYLYVSANGDIFGTTSVESLFLFVDSDGDPETGYAVGAMGAEYMLELDGWNDTVQSSVASRYSSSADRYDWNSWESIGGVASRLKGGEVEAMASLQQSLSSDARFMLLSQDQEVRRSVSSSVPTHGGVLIVTQRLSPSVPLSGVLPQEESTPLLSLTFECDGAGGSVESVSVELEGLPALSSAIEPFTLEPGDVETVEVMVDTSSLSSGQFVSACVSEDGIDSSFAGIVVSGHPARAYVGAAPEHVVIDGAFGDWYGRTASDVDMFEVPNDCIDVSEVGVFNTSLSSSFFVSVAGEMCYGSYVPVVKAKPVPSDGGPVVPLDRRTAEDITRIYIDSDMDSGTGLQVSVESKVIGADYRVEVRGVNCQVVSAVLHAYTGTSWALVSDELDAGVDSQRLEVGVLANNIGGAVAIDFIIETTDWRHYKDYVALDAATMLALTGGIASSVGTLAWAVDDSISDEATASSFQRKIFYDGTNFWSFFYDGVNTVCKYSSNGGVTWTDHGQVFTTSDMRKVSIWYDSSIGVVYVIGDTGAASEYAFIRRGVVSPSTPSITWGTEVAFDISGTNDDMAGKNTFITKDAEGHVWISVVTKVHDSLARYNMHTASTSSDDDVTGAWTDRGALIPTPPGYTEYPYCSATLVPGKSGSGVAMWAVYAYDGAVYSKTYSGSAWGSEMSIYAYTAGNSMDNTRYAPPSAVIDSSGVVHVAYGTGRVVSTTWRPNIEYRYSTSTSTWSTVLQLNAAAGGVSFKFPTMSLDSSTGNLYALWVKDATSSDNIEVKKNVTGTWSFLTVAQSSFTKTYLTSIYSAPGETYICWQWTQNTTSPYDVVFDKIPEFSDVVVPVLFMLTVFIAIYRRRSRPEEPA